MSDGDRRADAGPVDPLAIAGCLVDRPTVLILDGGPGGWCHLAWEVEARPLHALDDLPVVTGGRAESRGAGWPGPLVGGWLVQCDYELPVGPWALPLDVADPAGWAWRPRAWLSIAPDGTAQVHGEDARAVARARALLCGAAPVSLAAPRLVDGLTPAWDAAGHRHRVARIRDHIAAGTIYQANLTLPFTGRLAPGYGRDLAIYARLRAAAPAPYGCFLRHAGRTVISHSPECFLRVRGRQAMSEPIKGTRPRRPGCEDRHRRELHAAAKDNAELAMIVDLVRNDLGRVARPGGVRVERPGTVVDLPYVHHLIAAVVADLDFACDHRALLAAAFPAGSITGAPKIAAMRVIRAEEAGRRGPYCGSFGWLGAGVDCDLAVAIRTLVVDGDTVRLDAGGGIVADSDGDAEWREVQAKAGPMIAAVGGGDGKEPV